MAKTIHQLVAEIEEFAKDAPVPINGRDHHLKVWTEFFDAIESGAKPFEVRRNDRDYRVGDMLHLRDYDPYTDTFSGRTAVRVVSYILKGGIFGVDPEFVVMGLQRPSGE